VLQCKACHPLRLKTFVANLFAPSVPASVVSIASRSATARPHAAIASILASARLASILPPGQNPSSPPPNHSPSHNHNRSRPPPISLSRPCCRHPHLRFSIRPYLCPLHTGISRSSPFRESSSISMTGHSSPRLLVSRRPVLLLAPVSPHSRPFSRASQQRPRRQTPPRSARLSPPVRPLPCRDCQVPRPSDTTRLIRLPYRLPRGNHSLMGSPSSLSATSYPSCGLRQGGSRRRHAA